MKQDILKMAGVKNEKQFYKLFPSEEAFMKVHGKAFKKAKMGASMVKKQLTQLTDFANPPQAQGGMNLLPSTVTGLQGMIGKLPSGANPIKNIMGSAANIIGGIGAMKEEKEQLDEAKQFKELSGLTLNAANTRPEQVRRKYERPEDSLIEGNYQSFGTGYDVGMAESGMQIGGNPTEIQNMYTSGDIYSDMGYEPLDESSKVKQFQNGGGMFSNWQSDVTKLGPEVTGAFGSFAGGMLGGSKGKLTGAGQVGKGVGALAGSMFGPLGTAIGSGIGAFAGNLIGGQRQKKMEGLQEEGYENLQKGAFQQGIQNVQNQYGSFMEQGGYVSHNWQPQVITKFGDYNVKDLLRKDPMMDTLRTGGSIRNNYMGDDEKMSMMAMGGELKTHWGGDAEPISYNLYLPDGGETVMFRGQSHEESDGQGRTGIGVTYGDNPVEVERGEPAVKLKNGSSEEDSLVVFGNLKIPSYVASEINDDKAKGKSYKSHVEGISYKEAKQNKIAKKAALLANSVDGDTPYDLLKLNSAKASLIGTDMALQQFAGTKKFLGVAQNAMLDTAAELGIDAEAFANRNKIVKVKSKDGTAQNGSIVDYLKSKNVDSSIANRQKLAQEANILNYKGLPDQNIKLLDYMRNKKTNLISQPIASDEEIGQRFYSENPPIAERVPTSQESLMASGIGPTPTPYEPLTGLSSATTSSKEKPKNNNLLDYAKFAYNEALPFIRPSNQMQLDPSQLMGEMIALQGNPLEAVQAQSYQPLLETEPAALATAQSQLNEITASANAARRMTGNNPAAQAMIASQEAMSKQQVIGQQLAANVQAKEAARQRNLAALNDKTLKNLAIYDQQYSRQAQAKSSTKEIAQAALSSIASKIGQNKLENRQIGIMENMYNYRFGPKGRAINYNPMVDFKEMIANASPGDMEQYQEMIDKKGKSSASKESRNGSIVKAIKNL